MISNAQAPVRGRKAIGWAMIQARATPQQGAIRRCGIAAAQPDDNVPLRPDTGCSDTLQREWWRGFPGSGEILCTNLCTESTFLAKKPSA